MAELTVIFDPPEVRIASDRMAVLVTGSEAGRLQWDFLTLPDAVPQNNAVDENTFTGFLRPAWMYTGWETNARTPFLIRKADTDRAASASWVEKNFNFDGNLYLHSLNVNERVTTTASFDKNMPWWVSYYAYGQGDASFAQLEVQFGTGAEQVTIYFLTDSKAQIHRNGAFVGVVNLTQSEAWERAARATEGGARNNNQDQPIDLFIMPCRHRELLIYSSVGGTGNLVFEDIERTDPDPTILPSGVVSFFVADGQATFQAVPAKRNAAGGAFFETEGYLLSHILTLRQPPNAGETAEATAFYDLPHYDTDPVVTAQLVDEDGLTPFVGDGSKYTCRLKITMTGDGKNTPSVYGGQAVFDALTENTADDQVPVDDYLVQCSLSVPESPTDVVMDVTLLNEPAVVALIPKASTISNRPMVAKIGTIAILTGRAGSPKWVDMPTNPSQQVMLECRDRWQSFTKKRISDPTPYDGRLLSDVVKELAMSPGYPVSSMDVEANGLTLDERGQVSKGDYALKPERGDTVEQWLLRLHQDFAITAVIGWYPSATGPKFRWQTPVEFGGSLSGTETCTVYVTRAAALAAGFSEVNHTLKVYGEYDHDVLAIEANDFRATGWDKRLDIAIQAHEEDIASKAVTTLTVDRPNNWVGEEWPVTLWEPAITTQAMADYVAGVNAYRLFHPRWLGQWLCQMQFKTDGSPMWRGDVMKLNDKGRYRIIAFSADLILENVTRNQVRNAMYVGEYIGA